MTPRRRYRSFQFNGTITDVRGEGIHLMRIFLLNRCPCGNVSLNAWRNRFGEKAFWGVPF
jgi:hypothetical protein